MSENERIAELYADRADAHARLAAVEAYRQRCATTRTEPTLAGLTTALRAVVAADPADTSR